MITSDKIAQLCGISRGTVDRALNNRGRVSQKTKERVLKVASEYGYKPDFIARSLATGVTYTIGVIVLDLYNQFFSDLLNCVEAEARKRGYFIHIALSHRNAGSENSALEHFINRKVDGIILYSVQHRSEMFSKVDAAGIPMISIINRIGHQCGYIGINDKKAIFDAVKCLVDAGHKNIGYISFPLDLTGEINQYALTERFNGFNEALAKLNLPFDERRMIVGSGLHEGLKSLLDGARSGSQVLPDAFVCIDDLYAIETIHFLKKYSINVPEDISIVGFDNIQASGLTTPALTTVEYPVDIIAQKAVSRIVSEASRRAHADVKNEGPVNGELMDEILPTKLIVRESVKKLI